MVQENNLKKIIVIVGATASGKTALSVELAKKLNTEIISADSMLVYKGLDIGTAKPSLEERQGVKHHLIDVVSPKQTFSVSDYEELATKALDNIIKNGKIPIICGGTGFYINSLLFDLSFGSVAQNPSIRAKYELIAKEKGNEYLHSLLKEVDPKSAEEIHFNNVKRVIRALEIFEISGKKKSDFNDGLNKKYDYYAYSIDFPKEELIKRINLRVDNMFDNGLIDEAKNLINNGVNLTDQCMQGIGYKELFPYFNGENTLDEVKETIKLNTRHYAKRQLTFFKRLDGLKYLKPAPTSELVDFIINDIK